MAEKNRKTFFAGAVAAVSVLVVGGLVAWGAGYFEREAPSRTAPAVPPMNAGPASANYRLPPGHPSIDGLTASPGPLRADAPAGACPATGATRATDTNAAANGCPAFPTCTPEQKAAGEEPAQRGDPCEKNKEKEPPATN